jgi:hypothetical protein
VVLSSAGAAFAQIPGENVNMVTGTSWPGGDPFLQRQNEPSIAVSSENPQHLLAGANDYRSVDLPNPLDLCPGCALASQKPKMPGDAWLGVFKSLDGGQTWSSVLLPGFPQDTSTAPFQGASSPLRNCAVGLPDNRCTSAADPVVRAGTNGMLYFGGIAFRRGTNWGKVFVARFIDLNNKENGDPTRTAPGEATKSAPTDPIRYVDESVIATGSATVFLDKPWIAVDRPRALSQTCSVSVSGPDGAATTRSFPGGTVYAAWVRFEEGTGASDIMFSRSANCGKTWSTPVKLNDATSSLNQGPTIAIDPFTGFVYVAWRRIAWPLGAALPTQGDAIMVARSFRGFLFTRPRVVASFTPFEQASTGSMFRTEAFPSIAISVDSSGIRGFVHIAWSQRMPPYGDGRIVTSTASVLPTPSSGLERDDPPAGWSTPMPADDVGLTDDYARTVFARGHQFMPALTFSQGRLMLLYYDSRLDHASGVFEPNQDFTVPNPLTGRFYREEKVPITPTNGAPEDPANVLAPLIDDAAMRSVRHTVEVRVGASRPGPNPVFSSVQVSQYRFGERGDEPSNFSVPAFAVGDASRIDAGRAIQITDGTRFLRLQQFDVNPPNLPMFKNGTVPFLGDFIDIQGQAFVRKGTAWAFNTAPSPAPVFHAVWTTNQDVRAPRDGDWTRYTPLPLPGQTGSVFDPMAGTPPFCRDPAQSGHEATRNQNVYTSRITEGLLVTTPQNAKPLSPTETRSFVVLAQNTTSYRKALRFTVAGVDAAVYGTCAGAATACASFQKDAPVRTLDVVVLPHSSVSRFLFVRSPSPATTLVVNVAEVRESAGCTLAAGDCPLARPGLAGSVTLNPPGAAPSLVAPDGVAGIGTSGEIVLYANVSTANVSTANVSTANVSTANVTTAPISDLNYEVTNPGNTTTSYSVQVVRCPEPSCAITTPLQLIVSKFYTVPAAIECRLVAEPRSLLVSNGGLVQAAVVSAGSLVDPKVRDSSAANATVVLAPGERAQITLRGQVTLGEMAVIGSRIAPAVVPHATPIGGSTGSETYASAAAVGAPVTTRLVLGTAGFVATVAPATPGGPTPTGVVTFILNGSTILATVPLVDGQAQLLTTLAAGDQLTFYYGGDARYAGSVGTLTPTRTVTGTFQTTWWLDDGRRLTLPAPPPAGAVVSAMVETATGYDSYPGSYDAVTGALSIPGVPNRSYFLVVDARPAGGSYSAVQHVASTIDLTGERAGRPDAVRPTVPTSVTYDLSGLFPWTPSGDYVVVFGSRVVEYPFGIQSTSQTDLPAGAVTANVTGEWGLLNQGTLPDTSAGDVVSLHQMATATIPAGQPGAGLTYQTAAHFARLWELIVPDGVPTTITAGLAPPPSAGTVSLNLAARDYEALVADLGPGATWNGLDAAVLALPHTLAFPVPLAAGVPELLYLHLPPGTPNTDLGAFTFGRVLDPMWKEYLNVVGGGWVPVLASGATQPTSVSASMWSELPLGQATGQLGPRLGPPRSPTINGLSLSSPRAGVTTTPTIGWSAPAIGNATSYTVEIREVSRIGGRTLVRPRSLVSFTVFGGATQSLTLPPGILAAGREYIVGIQARSGPWDVIDAPPGRGYAAWGLGLPAHFAYGVSAKFSP